VTDQDAQLLQLLRSELDALGMVVVPFPNELHVRLSTLEYIKVRLMDGRLECEPWVKGIPRIRATWTLAMVGSAVIAALLRSDGITPATLAVSFVVVMSMVFTGIRHLLSDNCITRIQMAWLNCRPRDGNTETMSVDAGAPQRQLDHSRPAAPVAQTRQPSPERRTPR